MARNRRNQSAAIRFGPAIKAIVLCLCIGGFGIGYVWQKKQIDQLGQQLRNREVRLTELKRQNRLAHDALASLRRPSRLQAEALKLGLGPPQQKQILTLREPLLEATASAERLYAREKSHDDLSP